MSDNVIRQDLVQIGFEVDSGPLQKIMEMTDKMQSQMGKLTGKSISPNVNSGDIDKLKGSADKAAGAVDRITDMAEETKSSVSGIDSSGLDKIKEEAEKATEGIGGIKEEAEKAKAPVDDLDKSNFNKLQNGLKGVGDRLSTIAQKAAGAAYAGLKKLAGISFKALAVGMGGAAALVGASVKAYADFEQLEGGVQTLLGTKGAESVEDYAKLTGKSVKQVQGEYKTLLASENLVFKNANNAYKEAGLSANEYMETVTGFSASLLQSVGGDTVKAAKLADVAVKDMSDNANKMGSDMGSIQYAYQGFAKGNYGMLDNLKLGYGGTKEEAKRLVQEAAKLDKSVDANSMSYGNLVKAIHAVQVKTGIYGTTAQEADETISGSLASMKSAWGNLLPALVKGGDSFDQCVDNLVESAGTFGENIMPAIEKSLGGVGELIEKLAPIIEKEFPKLVQELLPSLLKAATALINGFIKALPGIVKTLANELPNILKQFATSLGEAFGIKSDTLKKFGDAFMAQASKISKAVPYLLGVLGALLAFKKVKGIGSFFSGLFGKKGGGSANPFASLTKLSPKNALKGMLNLTIILGGFAALAAAFMYVAPFMAQLADVESMLKVVGVIAVLGVLGLALSKLAETAGKMPVSKVAKGIANIAISIGGLTAVAAVFMFVAPYIAPLSDIKSLLKIVGVIAVLGVVGTALSKLAGIAGGIPVSKVAKGLVNIGMSIAGLTAVAAGFMAVAPYMSTLSDIRSILKIAGVITVLGVVGTALSVMAGIAGRIPVATVAKGLANIAICIGGLSGLFMVIGAVSLLDFDYLKILQLVGIIGALGVVGSILAGFAGLVGMIPVPVVLSGLANIALVINGMAALIAEFAALSMIPGFDDFISRGGDTLANLFNQIGKIGGALIGGIGEGITASLPAIGDNLTAFVAALQPMFSMLEGVDVGAVGSFFTAIGGFMLQMAGEQILSFFTGGLDTELGTKLTALAQGLTGFFKTVATFPEEGFKKATSLFATLSNIGSIPKTGGVMQWFGGNADYTGVANGLTQLGGPGMVNFFKTVSELPEEGFQKATQLFTTLSDIDNLPKTGGLVQQFTGEANLTDLAAKLPAFGTSMASFFKSISAISDFNKAKQLFASLQGMSEAIPESGGFWQKIAGEKNIGVVGTQLKQFGTDTKEFFAQVSALNIGNLNGLWSALKTAAEVASIDLSGLASKGTALTEFMTNAKGFFTGAGEIVGQLQAVNAVAVALQLFFVVISGIVGTSLVNINSGLAATITMITNTAASFTLLGLSILVMTTVGLTAFKNMVTQSVSAISTGFAQMLTIISTKYTEIIDKTKSAMAQIVEIISGTNLYNAGVNVMQGLNNGMVSMIPILQATAQRAAQAIDSATRNTLGIRSPARVMIANGEDTGMGQVVGMERTLPKLRSTATELGEASVPYARSYSPEGNTAGGSLKTERHESYSIAPQFNLTINGAADPRAEERRVKRWIKEALDDTFQSMGRKNGSAYA